MIKHWVCARLPDRNPRMDYEFGYRAVTAVSHFDLARAAGVVSAIVQGAVVRSAESRVIELRRRSIQKQTKVVKAIEFDRSAIDVVRILKTRLGMDH